MALWALRRPASAPQTSVGLRPPWNALAGDASALMARLTGKESDGGCQNDGHAAFAPFNRMPGVSVTDIGL